MLLCNESFHVWMPGKKGSQSTSLFDQLACHLIYLTMDSWSDLTSD